MGGNTAALPGGSCCLPCDFRQKLYRGLHVLGRDVRIKVADTIAGVSGERLRHGLANSRGLEQRNERMPEAMERELTYLTLAAAPVAVFSLRVRAFLGDAGRNHNVIIELVAARSRATLQILRRVFLPEVLPSLRLLHQGH